MKSKHVDAMLQLRRTLNAATTMPGNNKDSSNQKTTIGVYEWRAVPAAAYTAWVDSGARVNDSVDMINVVIGSGDSLSTPV
jgi:hypothetical protein